MLIMHIPIVVQDMFHTVLNCLVLNYSNIYKPLFFFIWILLTCLISCNYFKALVFTRGPILKISQLNSFQLQQIFHYLFFNFKIA